MAHQSLPVELSWPAHLSECGGEALALPSVDCIRTVCRSKFKRGTGLGCDLIHPFWIAYCSDDLISALALLMLAVEQTGILPDPFWIKIFLARKLSGGWRPIGLLPTFIRVWEAVREGQVQEWASKNSRDYTWAGKGRSAEGAVWLQALDAEGAVDPLSAATCLIDLVKAFEAVPHAVLVARALQFQFLLVILRVLLCVFPWGAAL